MWLFNASTFFRGDSSRVQAQLWEVQHIQATRQAFAAIRSDHSVVTWGNEDYGVRHVVYWLVDHFVG